MGKCSKFKRQQPGRAIVPDAEATQEPSRLQRFIQDRKKSRTCEA